MSQRVGLVVFLTLFLLTNYVASQSKELGKNAYKQPIKTIKTEHGDIYNCVDFYEQPAFSHPALKDHNFHPEMRPSFKPKKTSSTHSYPNNPKTITFGLKDKACPQGTVPIRNIEEGDFNQVESLAKNHGMMINTRKKVGTHVAVARSKSPQVYHGVTANLTIHHPLTNGDEYSSGQISIKNNPESIQVGWTVNPTYYKDDKTRMFIYTDASGNSCYNTDCPGFVIVRTDIPLDSVLAPLSEPRGPLSYVDFLIYQDPTFKIWWLEVGHDGTQMGFWPQRIFTKLATSGSYVECGGEVYHNATKPGVAMMGNGIKPSKHVETNSYCYNFKIVNQDTQLDMANDTEAYTDLPEFYGVEDKFIPKHDIDTNIVLEFEHIVIYGGVQDYE